MSVEHPTVAFVVPCYNEQAVFPHTLQTLLALVERLIADGKISKESHLLFVDDGSRDETWSLIERAHAEFPLHVRALKLTRNFGHQNALLAGLLMQIGKADAVISLDADLQDDISVTEQMIDYFRAGKDIVFGVRAERASDTAFKRSSARWYYRLMQWLGVDLIAEHGDFRLMSDKALRALAQFGEVHVFLRGLVRQLGLQTQIVYFERKPRLYGETKYNLPKMLTFAANGITSFSVVPLRIVTVFGMILFVASVIAIIWVLQAWTTGTTVEGWTSLMVIFLLVSSFQALGLGIMGEYVGKTYFETKSRPRYLIDKDLSS